MKNTMKKPVAILVEKLHPFAGHPFKVKDDAEMNTLIESVQTQGILSPLIVQPIDSTDEYDVISGHRRLHAAQKAGITERCLPIRKHRGAREKRYSFGYAVFLILALMK